MEGCHLREQQDRVLLYETGLGQGHPIVSSDSGATALGLCNMLV